MAISLCLRDARASSRLATLAHAISSTHPAAESRMMKAVRLSPSTSSFSDTTVIPTFWFVPGNSRATGGIRMVLEANGSVRRPTRTF
jgi:hypothetical protein